MIPSRVKVGGLFYDITVTDEPIILNTQQCKGLIDYEKQTIKLAGDSVQSEQGRMQTLWHELVHALRHSRNLDWDDKDELYTDEIGIAIHAFFVDNNISLPGQG
jgi:Zn-dependent peptidase ImmA (M78 family)